MTNKIKKAFELMYKLEPERYRKFSPLPQGKELYWTHLYSVYKLCVYCNVQDEDVLLAAILHDAVEDTDYTLEDIKSEFGESTAEIVSLCTKKKSYTTFKNEDQEEYFNRIFNYPNTQIKHKAMTVKLADRLDNLTGASFIEDRETKQKYLDETQKYYTKIAQELGKEIELNNLCKYVQSILESKI